MRKHAMLTLKAAAILGIGFVAFSVYVLSILVACGKATDGGLHR